MKQINLLKHTKNNNAINIYSNQRTKKSKINESNEKEKKIEKRRIQASNCTTSLNKHEYRRNLARRLGLSVAK